jgi:hypothetical protein
VVRITFALCVGGTLGPDGKNKKGIPNAVDIQAVIRSYYRISFCTNAISKG